MTDTDSRSDDSKRILIFSYGTLKQGFRNHHLIQDLISKNDAIYLGPHITNQQFPLVCGPFNIPYLINQPGSGNRVKGELYSVSTWGLVRLDELEGTSIGHYDRLPVQVTKIGEDGTVLVEAEGYFANTSFAERLWDKKGKVGLSEYNEEEGSKYVRIEERGRDTSILNAISSYLSS